MKRFPDYTKFSEFIDDIQEQLKECDSHSDFDAVLGRFIDEVDEIEWSEYRATEE